MQQGGAKDALVRNVATERLALKVDAVNALVRERLGLLERRRRRRDGEDAATVGDDLAVRRRLGAGVEDVDICVPPGSVSARQQGGRGRTGGTHSREADQT